MTDSCAVLHRLATRHPLVELTDLTKEITPGQLIASTFVATSSHALRQRLRIYSEGYFGRIAEAMRKSFEVTAQALGEDAFDECVWHYLRKHPSNQPNLRWVGNRFPNFLRLSPTERKFEWHGKPWLAELASLEWAHSLAFDAKNLAPVLFSDLLALAPEQWGTLRLAWHPTVQRVDTGDALLSLLEGSADWAAPESTPQCVLIWRANSNVMHQPLMPGEATLFDALQNGLSIADFCKQVAESEQLDEQQAATKAGSLLKTWMNQHCLVRSFPQ